MDLTAKRCVPCGEGTPPLGRDQAVALLTQVKDWRLAEGDTRITKRLKFRDFKQAMAFVNGMAALAESEDHHPDFTVRYNVVDITLWTHAAGGLTENDFILAAKIDQLSEKPSRGTSTA